MRKFRSSQQWQALFAEFESGSLSVVEFCKLNGLSTSNFYARRAALGESSLPQSGFAVAMVKPSAVVDYNAKCAITPSGITLEFGQATLRFPSATSPEFLAQVVRGLSA